MVTIKNTTLVLAVIILLLIFFALWQTGVLELPFRHVPLTLIDMCYNLYEDNRPSNYYIQGQISSYPHVINVSGKIISHEWVFRVLNYTSAYSGKGNDIIAYFRLCNSKGNCFEWNEYIPAYDYSGCLSNCIKYNWPAQCKYAKSMVVTYNCENLCRYDWSVDMHFDKIPPDKSYTLTLVKTQIYRGTWIDGGTIPPSIFQIFFDPNIKPWECVSNWQCGNWSSCGCNNTQTRVCLDLSQCEYPSTPKPAEIQTCVRIPQWTCANWSHCINGEQVRNCVDECGQNKTERRTCCMPNWLCTEWTACTGGIQQRICSDGCGVSVVENRTCNVVECVVASQCEGRPHTPCIGHWECNNNKCIWICDVIPECRAGDVKYYKCPDGSNVEWCVCQNEKWVCLLSPEANCIANYQPSVPWYTKIINFVKNLFCRIFRIWC